MFLPFPPFGGAKLYAVGVRVVNDKGVFDWHSAASGLRRVEGDERRGGFEIELYHIMISSLSLNRTRLPFRREEFNSYSCTYQ